MAFGSRYPLRKEFIKIPTVTGEKRSRANNAAGHLLVHMTKHVSADLPVKMFWNAGSTLVESRADVSIKLRPFFSAKAFASSVGIDLQFKTKMFIQISPVTKTGKVNLKVFPNLNEPHIHLRKQFSLLI